MIEKKLTQDDLEVALAVLDAKCEVSVRREGRCLSFRGGGGFCCSSASWSPGRSVERSGGW
jgi:hypothetical protein